MNQVILPGARSGNWAAVPSKSQLHRLLICAALSKKPAAAAPSAYSPRRRKDDENAEANRRAAGERVTARFFMASISAFVMSVSLAEMTEKACREMEREIGEALIQSELPENSLAYTAKTS